MPTFAVSFFGGEGSPTRIDHRKKGKKKKGEKKNGSDLSNLEDLGSLYLTSGPHSEPGSAKQRTQSKAPGTVSRRRTRSRGPAQGKRGSMKWWHLAWGFLKKVRLVVPFNHSNVGMPQKSGIPKWLALVSGNMDHLRNPKPFILSHCQMAVSLSATSRFPVVWPF